MVKPWRKPNTPILLITTMALWQHAGDRVNALLVSEGFLLLGDRGNRPPPSSITTTRQKFVHLPCISNNFISQKRLIPSLLSKNFHHFYFNCTLFLHTDHTNFSFTSCSIFMSRIIFYLEKGLNGQIHSFPDPHHLIKKI